MNSLDDLARELASMILSLDYIDLPDHLLSMAQEIIKLTDSNKEYQDAKDVRRLPESDWFLL